MKSPYNEQRVAEMLAQAWDRPDAGASAAAWLNLDPVEDTSPPDRPAVALVECVERLRMRALPHRMGDDLPSTLRTPGAPLRRRRPAARRSVVPHPAVLAALHGESTR